MMYVVVSFLGLFHPWVYGFLLLDLIIRSSLLKASSARLIWMAFKRGACWTREVLGTCGTVGHRRAMRDRQGVGTPSGTNSFP
jgi:hypothetical protein